MKLYLVAPKLADNSDNAAEGARLRACNEIIAELICRHVSTDPALFGMRDVNDNSDPPVELGTRYGCADTVRLADPNMLREILVACGDPNSGEWILIRSLVTCRTVVFGYDGQAFVCLPSDADPIVSPDETLVTVEECSHLLTETDWVDGLSGN
ncbi:hypothetical protein ACFQRC_12315 [Enterovirga sp. GCM10030262]|uniref:hypothetical protein n=1 Tax=Enterovirga sp. GCM10030262 TaxID=3273391 RepID=UPI00361EEC6B